MASIELWIQWCNAHGPIEEQGSFSFTEIDIYFLSNILQSKFAETTSVTLTSAIGLILRRWDLETSSGELQRCIVCQNLRVKDQFHVRKMNAGRDENSYQNAVRFKHSSPLVCPNFKKNLIPATFRWLRYLGLGMESSHFSTLIIVQNDLLGHIYQYVALLKETDNGANAPVTCSSVWLHSCTSELHGKKLISSEIIVRSAFSLSTSWSCFRARHFSFVNRAEYFWVVSEILIDLPVSKNFFAHMTFVHDTVQNEFRVKEFLCSHDLYTAIPCKMNSVLVMSVTPQESS